MRLFITDEGRNLFLSPLGVREEEVRDVVSKPEQSETVTFSGGKVTRFYVGGQVRRGRPPLLVHGEAHAGTVSIYMALPIPNWDRSTYSDATPTEVLRRFAESYGVDVSVAGTRRRFFLNDTFPAAGIPPNQVLRVHLNWPSQRVITSAWLKHLPASGGGGGERVECAMCFAFDPRVVRTAAEQFAG